MTAATCHTPPDTRCPTSRTAPRETTRTGRSAGTHPQRRSTVRRHCVRCVPDHIILQSTVYLHPPLDMHLPTPHSRVGLPRRRLSEALSGTGLRKLAKQKGYET